MPWQQVQHFTVKPFALYAKAWSLMENGKKTPMYLGMALVFMQNFCFVRPNLFSLTNDFVWHFCAQQETCYAKPISAPSVVTGFLGMFCGGWFLFMLQSMGLCLLCIVLFFMAKLLLYLQQKENGKLLIPFFCVRDLHLLLTPLFCLFHLTAYNLNS